MRYGYQRIHVLLQREGWHVNHRKVLRIYREEGLNLRSKRPGRRVAAANRLAARRSRRRISAGAWVLYTTICLAGNDFAR